MLHGRFGDTSGQPYIEGYVYIPRLGWKGNISFIFDTGADNSVLMPTDANRMKIDYRQLGNESQAIGIGGISNVYVETARLGFSCDKVLYGYEIDIHICKPRKELMKIPSILGRDIISQWRVTYDQSVEELSAELKSWDERIMIAEFNTLSLEHKD